MEPLRRSFVAVLGLLAGCGDTEDAARETAIHALGCPAASITLTRTSAASGPIGDYEAEGCGRSARFTCQRRSRTFRTTCFEVMTTPAPAPAPPHFVPLR